MNKINKHIIHVGPDLKEQGGVVTVITSILNLKLDESYRINTLSTSTSKHKIFTFIKSIFKFLKLCIGKKVSIVHIHMASNGSFYRKSIILVISKLFNIKAIIHLHGACFKEFYADMRGVKKKYCHYIFNKADKIIVLTESWKKFLENFIEEKNKIAVVSNFVCVPEYKSNTKKEESKLPKILFLGRLGKRKGTYDLINAAEKLKLKGIEFRIIIAGDGEIEKCKSIINEKALDNNIDIVGWINKAEKEKYLKEGDILVLPSYFESFGLSLIEGMSYKLPVITTLVGGIPEVVKHEEDGILITPGDVNELADKLEILIKNPEMRKSMGESGYKHVKEEFSETIAAKKINDIYAELLN